jgi:hypothetical protein
MGRTARSTDGQYEGLPTSATTEEIQVELQGDLEEGHNEP